MTKISKGTQQRVFDYMVKHQQSPGVFQTTLSQKALARKLGIGHSTFVKAVACLKKSKRLKVHRKPGGTIAYALLKGFKPVPGKKEAANKPKARFESQIIEKMQERIEKDIEDQVFNSIAGPVQPLFGHKAPLRSEQDHLADELAKISDVLQKRDWETPVEAATAAASKLIALTRDLSGTRRLLQDALALIILRRIEKSSVADYFIKAGAKNHKAPEKHEAAKKQAEEALNIECAILHYLEHGNFARRFTADFVITTEDLDDGAEIDED